MITRVLLVSTAVCSVLMCPMQTDDLSFPMILAKTEKLELWRFIINDWERRLSNVEQTHELIELMAAQIQQKYPFKLNSFHELSLSHIYSSIIRQSNLNQEQLVQTIELMMEQNIKLDIGMNTVVWDNFFLRYFASDLYYEAFSIFKLLHQMENSGSHVTPDLKTFRIIISGIASNQRIVKPVILIDAVTRMMRMLKVFPDAEIRKSQLIAFARTGNI